MNKSKIKKQSKTIYLLRSNKTKFGGAEVYLSRLTRVLSKNNIDHEVVNSIAPNFFPSWLRVLIFNIQVSIFKRSRFYFSLDRVICPDVYRAGDGVHKIFLEIEKKSKLNPLHPIYLFVEKRCFQRAHKIIAISKMVKNNIISSYGIDSNKISVIYNGIDLKKVDYESSFSRISKTFPLKKNTKVILFVGSGYKRKGLEEFIRIIAALKNQEVIAIVVGKEKNITYYKNLTLELGINSRVIFAGARTDVDDFYAISDIFLFPTHYEPFGNVILEAMNMKNVVFTTSQCGGSELLSREFIMKNPSDFSIVEKIDKLLVNIKDLRSNQEFNRKKSKNFSIEKNLEQTLNIIDEVID